jgi:hypothetical protein
MREPYKKLKFNITVNDINELKPCYPAETKLGENWSGNLIDVLKLEKTSPEDKLWAVTLFLGDRLNRLFAVHCARQALMLIENPDHRSVAACDVAERFANGQATKEELAVAWHDGRVSAAREAAMGAAMGAAWVSGARYAARVSAREAAMGAAMGAARGAAAAAWEAQIDFLIQMIQDCVEEKR